MRATRCASKRTPMTRRLMTSLTSWTWSMLALAIAAPTGSVSVTGYGAVGGRGHRLPHQRVPDLASSYASTGKTVWVPKLAFFISSHLNLPPNTTIEGAGMWCTTLLGSATLYSVNSSRRVNLNGQGSNIHLADFAIAVVLRLSRNDNVRATMAWAVPTAPGQPFRASGWNIPSPPRGLSVRRAWSWMAAGFASTIADGININAGMQGSTIVT